jgi:rhodanese-related sulfurtransferase
MVVTWCVLLTVGFFTPAVAKDVPRMTKEQLKEKLDTPNVVVIDVRIGKDWKASDVKIKGSVREDPKEVKEWVSKLDKEKTYVLYCA